jgi:peroxiredoxin
VSRRTRYAAGGLAVLLLAGAALTIPRVIRVPDPVGVGFRAPEFEARSVSDSMRVARLSAYRGSVVLLNVWATWCDPCRREMPSIERLYQELGPKGLRVLAVSIDDAGAGRDIREFAREHGLTFDILHDPTGGIQRTYQLIGVPESFLIDRDGVIRKKAFESDWFSAENRNLVAQLLGN